MRAASRFRLLFALAIVLVQVATAIALPTGEVVAQTATIQVVPNRYIVVLKPASGITAASVAAAYDARPGVEVTQVFATAIRGFAVEVDPGTARDLMTDPNVEGVFPDVISQGAKQEQPVGIDRVDADLNPVVAGDNAGAVDVDVAVIDSGVADHPDLDLRGGKDCTHTGSYLDDHGHGTHVAGTVAARDNDSGVVGVAPGARVWAVKVLHFDNFGSESEIICGLDWVATNAATIEVANMSIQGFYGFVGNDCRSQPYHQAVCAVANAGVTIVVAAGNGDLFGRPTDTREIAPAQFNEVLTVSAFYDGDGKPGGKGPASPSWGNADDTMAPFSNFGADVDLAAPGVDVLSLDYEGGAPIRMSGTSMASPHVAGAAALVRVQEGITSLNGIRSRLQLAGWRGPVPGDLDAYPEPELNVAQLGPGSMTSPASGTVGQQIEVVVTDCIPDSRMLTRFDGVFMGGTSARDDGAAVRRFKVPSSTRGTHTITATCEGRSFSRSFSVQPSIRLTPASGAVDDTVTVSLRGFKSGESVLIEFDTGPGVRKPVRISTSQTGAANGSFVVPSSVGGPRTVTAEGNRGTVISTSYTVQPSVRLSDRSLEGNQPAVLNLRGFGAGEVVEFRWDSAGGDLLGTKTTTATGSGTATVNLPNGASEGNHKIYAVGNQGTSRQISLSYSPALEPTPSPNATESATAEPTATEEPPASPEPTAEPTEAASPEPEPTETAPPTETPTVTASETPMEELPTETATVESPTETPTPVPTDLT
jgi:subtilisin family serine protease